MKGSMSRSSTRDLNAKLSWDISRVELDIHSKADRKKKPALHVFLVCLVRRHPHFSLCCRPGFSLCGMAL